MAFDDLPWAASVGEYEDETLAGGLTIVPSSGRLMSMALDLRSRDVPGGDGEDEDVTARVPLTAGAASRPVGGYGVSKPGTNSSSSSKPLALSSRSRCWCIMMLSLL